MAPKNARKLVPEDHKLVWGSKMVEFDEDKNRAFCLWDGVLEKNKPGWIFNRKKNKFSRLNEAMLADQNVFNFDNYNSHRVEMWEERLWSTTKPFCNCLVGRNLPPLSKMANNFIRLMILTWRTQPAWKELYEFKT